MLTNSWHIQEGKIFKADDVAGITTTGHSKCTCAENWGITKSVGAEIGSSQVQERPPLMNHMVRIDQLEWSMVNIVDIKLNQLFIAYRKSIDLFLGRSYL